MSRRASIKQGLCYIMLCLALLLCAQPLTPMVFADDPIPDSELEALEEYPSWVAPICDPSAGGGSASSGGSISGDIKSLAEQVWNNDKISYDYGREGEVAVNFQRLKNGEMAQTATGREVAVDPIILITLLHIAKSHKVNVSSLTDGGSHTAVTNPHGSGKGLDINILDGKHNNGSDETAYKIINSAAEVLPNGSRFGMGDYPFGTKTINGKTFHSFADNATHVHLDVLGVSKGDIDAAVAAAGGGGSASASAEPEATPTDSGGQSALLIGDSITLQAKDEIKAAFDKAGTPITIDASSGRSLVEPGTDGAKTSGLDALNAAKIDPNISKTKTVIMQLGTNGGNTKDSIGKALSIIDSFGPDSDRVVYWVDAISVGGSDDSVMGAANKAIYDAVQNQGIRVVPWFNIVSPKGDPEKPAKREQDTNQLIDNNDKLGVHLTIKGRAALADIITKTVKGSLPKKAASAANCCQQGGTAATSLAGGDDNTTGVFAIKYLVSKMGVSTAGAAGMIGNMALESVGVEPQRLQGLVSVKTPAESIPADKRRSGYGIVQWTAAEDKILKAAKPITKANDLTFQLDYLIEELKHPSYTGMVGQLKTVDSPAQASDLFLDIFEKPKYPEESRSTRQSYATAYFNNVTKNTPLPKNVPRATYNGPSAGTGCGASSGKCSIQYGSVNGSGQQYSQEQLKSLFGEPGTATSHTEMEANLTEMKFLTHTVLINKKAADCLQEVAQEIESKNSTYKIKMMGCYRYDSDNGSSNIGLRSYHTYGVACDINWDTNPFVSGGAEAPHDMPDEWVQAFKAHGFTWGGEWSSVKDYMHFEFNGIKP